MRFNSRCISDCGPKTRACKRLRSDTIGAVTNPDPTARDEAADAKRRLELMALFAEPDRYDFEAAEHAWGGDESAAGS